MRKQFIFFSVALPLVFIALALMLNPLFWFGFLVLIPLIVLGYYDMNQTKHRI